MTFKVAAALVMALCVVAVSPGAAATRHHPRHRHAPHVVVPPPAASRPGNQPHMIEVRPGLWISSWGCITDEGQGRFRPCDLGGGAGSWH